MPPKVQEYAEAHLSAYRWFSRPYYYINDTIITISKTIIWYVTMNHTINHIIRYIIQYKHTTNTILEGRQPAQQHPGPGAGAEAPRETERDV